MLFMSMTFMIFFVMMLTKLCLVWHIRLKLLTVPANTVVTHLNMEQAVHMMSLISKVNRFNIIKVYQQHRIFWLSFASWPTLVSLCLGVLMRMVCKMGGKWPYSYYFFRVLILGFVQNSMWHLSVIAFH